MRKVQGVIRLIREADVATGNFESNMRLKTEYGEYASPQGAGTMRGYVARPADSRGNLAAHTDDDTSGWS